MIKLKLKINFRILPTPQGKTRLQSPYIPHHIPASRVLTVRFLHHSLVWVSRWSLVQVSYKQAIPLYEYIHTSPPRVMIFFEGARKVIFWGGEGLAWLASFTSKGIWKKNDFLLRRIRNIGLFLEGYFVDTLIIFFLGCKFWVTSSRGGCVDI